MAATVTTFTTVVPPGVGGTINGQQVGAGTYTVTATVSAPSSSGESSRSSSSSGSSSSGGSVAPFGGGVAPTLPLTIITSSSAGSSAGIVISSVSTPTSGTTGASGAAAGTTTPSNSASATPAPQSNTGLIAGIAVLGVLLAIALGVILFLILRRQRRKYPPGEDMSSRSRGLTEKEEKGNKGRGNITSTEVEASLLAGGRSAAVIDDKQANSKFTKLNHEIKDWVLTHFRTINPRTNSTSQEVLQGIRNQPNYRTLLQDSRGKYLVLRGIVADGLTDAFENGEINGFGDVFGMKERFPTNVGAREKATWRSSTVLLLEKDSGFRERQARAVETIAQRINYVTTNVAGVEYSEARLRQLTTVVQSAAELALDLSRQRMNFTLVHPHEETFDPAVMDDVLQETPGEQLRNYRVLSVVFPAVVRYGDEHGEGFDRKTVISKALVLVEGHAI